MKNPQTSLAPTFLTHIIARIDGVPIMQTYVAHNHQTKIEIVMNELQTPMIAADFLRIHPIIFVGVQECKVLV